MLKFFRLLKNMHFSIDGQCPQTQRGRPVGVDEGGAAGSELSLCEKTTKKGRKIYYKTKQQKEIDKKGKEITKQERAKSGGKLRGRIAKSTKETIAQRINEMKEIVRKMGVKKEATTKAPKEKKVSKQKEIHDRLKKAGYPFALPKITPENEAEWEKKLAGYENTEKREPSATQQRAEEKKPAVGGEYNSAIKSNTRIQDDSRYIENDVSKKLEGEVFESIKNSPRTKYNQPIEIKDIALDIQKKYGVKIGGGLLLKTIMRMDKEGKVIAEKNDIPFGKLENPEFLSLNWGPALYSRVRFRRRNFPEDIKVDKTQNPTEDLKAISDTYYKKSESELMKHKGKKLLSRDVEKILGSGAMAKDVIKNLISSGKAKLTTSFENNMPLNDIPMQDFSSLGVINIGGKNVLAREIEIL